MALEVVGGAFLSAFLEEVIDKMYSREVMDFIQGKKFTEVLLNNLKITLLSVNSVLDDAEEKQISSPDVKQWLTELKEAIYNAEDLLNEIKAEALRRKVEAEFGNSTSKMLKKFSKKILSPWFHAFEKAVDSQIQDIIGRLEFIAKQKAVLNLKADTRCRISQTLPSTSLIEVCGLYGRDKDKETIIKSLLSDDSTSNKISVIPIVGMGGIGKTTLAQLVYNDSRVKQHFDVHVWVCVSEEFDIIRMTQTIYGSLGSQNCDITDLNMLQVKLKEALSAKKIFLVLDDVWNENYSHWDALRRPLESAAHGSKIIVTTRNASVASTMGSIQTHHLTQISEEDCWLLFARHAFKNRVDADPNLEVIGKQIIRKCKGLPLAAKSLGSLLCSESNIEEWENVLKHDIWQLTDKEATILPALWLSYHYLPRHLKSCFAYCSVFPKDFPFTKSRLVFLWMAEDLLQPKNKKTAEEVGEDYFDDLLSRSFFQHSQGDSDHQPVFTMHDLINDLAKFVSGDFCVRLEDSGSLDNVSKVSRARHFSYMKTYGDGFEKFEPLYDAKRLRTFLPLSLRNPIAAQFQMSDKILHDLLPQLKCLRVLNLSGYNICDLPNSIGNLKQLKHLDMSYTLIEKLPEPVCKLYNLQALLLSYCRGLVQLPTNLERLINLRHLDIRGTKIEQMPPLGKLKDLQTLSNFPIDKTAGYHDIVELKELQQLRGSLCISGLQNILSVSDVAEAKMKDKKYLSQLVLKWGRETDDSQKDREVLENLQPHTNLKELMIVSYEGTRFPDWLVHHSFSNLYSLQLLNCQNCYFLPPLGQLPSLRELEIIGLNGVVSIGAEFYGDATCATKPFGSLQVLKFENMREWQKWSYVGGNEGGGAFPNLHELRLRNCPKLTGRLPLECFPKIRTLLVCRTNIYSLTFVQQTTCEELQFLDYMYIYCPNFASFPSGGLHAPNLTKIHIFRCKKLRSLPEEMHTLLPSLQSMQITYCPELESFPEGGLPSRLNSLEVESCKKLISNRMQWGLQRLMSLQHLLVNFGDCEEVCSFPEEGLLPATLTSLSISTLSSVKTMEGKGFRELTALQSLAIRRCPELQCLPDEGLPTSLSLLEIFYCPLLKQRYQRDKGEDWPKIAHIRHIMIDGEHI